jgi:ApaG protein
LSESLFTMNEKNTIVVETLSRFIQEQSDPAHDRYVFAYTITISNRGTQGVKLLSRAWLITDSNGKIEEVRGEGVVGKQPYLKPGQMFRYTSGAVLETAVGVMQGHYFFSGDDGENFSVPIPQFTLSIPRTLH